MTAAGPAPYTGYRGRRAALATMHGKERALAGPLRAGTGLELAVPEGLDTDAFGTFTGEVERRGSPAEVALRKARAGMERLGLPLGLASEGSFGPHPLFGVVPFHREVLVFADAELGIEVIERSATLRTNFDHAVVAAAGPSAAFLERVGFPGHALVVRPNAAVEAVEAAAMAKGIADAPTLRAAVARAAAASDDGRARVETDMRAMHNPRRLRVLRRLAGALSRRLRATCPSCGAPGWGLEGLEPGLPCAACGTPTGETAFERHACPACRHGERRPRRDGRTTAEPVHCPACNP